jgi:hypothetical protein
MGYVEDREGMIDSRGPDAMDLFTLGAYLHIGTEAVSKEDAWAAFVRLFHIKNEKKFINMVEFF